MATRVIVDVDNDTRLVRAVTTNAKKLVRDHWDAETCGTRYGVGATDDATFFREIRRARYELEPYILAFQDAAAATGLDVLEIGVGAGSDFVQWPEAGAHAVGIDLTKSAVETTRRHLENLGHASVAARVFVADAEQLPFRNESFDLIYSFGVLHHSPDTERALREVNRVLKKGGQARIMIYRSPSWIAWMLWLRYALLKGEWSKSARQVVFEQLESPGTKVYTESEAEKLLLATGFTDIRMHSQLGPGDLFTISPSKKYRSPIYRLVWSLYPRRLVRALGNRFGLGLLIEVRKPQ